MKIKALSQKTLLSRIIMANALLVSPIIWAAPQGGIVTSGTGDINSQGLITNIHQSSQQLIVDWNSFNLNANEIVNFYQPDASSVAVNNINQYDGSRINGQINANGQIILINPRGLIFGSDSQINTAGLIVSTLSVAKESFLNGEYFFQDLDDGQGVIINNGTIHASSGGITLLGDSVINNGIIQAELGYINLAAGKQAYLSFDDQGFLSVKIDQEVLNNELGLDQAIENNGELSAGGRVAISAKTSSELFDRAINNTGIVKATGFNLNEPNNEPSIIVTSNGDINNSGTLDASSTRSGQAAGLVTLEGNKVIHSGVIDVSHQQGVGGNVDILGDLVGLDNAAIVNANGQQGGGDIQIGGSYQGKDDSVKNATSTYVSSGSSITANAGISGDGGDIVVWADQNTQYYGNIEAKGGRQSGNGGDVEVSGKEYLNFEGSVDLSATNGQSGELLLDPDTLTVIADGAGDESDFTHNNLSGTDGLIEFPEVGLTNATIKAETLQTLLNTNNVKLTATDLINVNSSIINAGSTNTLELYSNGAINVNALIQTNGELIIEGGASSTIQLNNNVQGSSVFLSANELIGNGAITVSDRLNIEQISQSLNYTGLVTGSDATLVTSSVNNTFDLTEADKQFKISNATFTGFNNVTSGANASINGTLASEDFIITSAENLLVNGIAFSQVTQVDAKVSTQESAIDSVSGSSNWALAADGFQASGITFKNIDVANSGESGLVTGTVLTDKFKVVGDNSVLVAGTTFNQVDDVVANTGENDVEFNGDEMSIQGMNDISLNGIDFSNIKTINKYNINNNNSQSLLGTSLKDDFVIVSTNTVSVNGITYHGIGNVDGKGSGFDSITGLTGQTWTIERSTELENLNAVIGYSGSGILFSNIESADSISSGGLIGTDFADQFKTTGNSNQINFENAYIFDAIVTVDAKQNTALSLNTLDTLDTANFAEESFSVNTNNSIFGNGITFKNVEKLSGEFSDTLTLLNPVLNYKLTLENTVYGFETTLLSDSSEVINEGYSASGIINDVSFSGLSNDNAETYLLEKVGEKYQITVLVNGVKKITSQEFTDLVFVDGIDNNDTLLFDTSIELDSNNMFDTDTRMFSTTLTGSSNATRFSNFKIYDLSEIGNDHSLGFTNTIARTFTVLEGVEYGFSEADTQFLGFDQINTNASGNVEGQLNTLQGTEGDEQFELLSSNGNAEEPKLLVNQVAFSGIGIVNAGTRENDDDQIISNTSQNWQLAENGAFSSQGIVFNNVERASAVDSSIQGSINSDIFKVYETTNTVDANGIVFENIKYLDGDSHDQGPSSDSLVIAPDQLFIHSNNDMQITALGGADRLTQVGDPSELSLDYKNIEIVDIKTTGNVSSTAGFKQLNIDAENLTINTADDVTFDRLSIKDDMSVTSQGSLNFLSDTELTGRDVSLVGEEISFRGSLKVASNTFFVDAKQLNVEGDIDADVNAERSVAIDIGQDINVSIFKSIDIFLASDNSIFRDDEIDNSDRLKRLLEETELEL